MRTSYSYTPLILLGCFFCISLPIHASNLHQNPSIFRVDTIDCCNNIWRYVYMLNDSVKASKATILAGEFDAFFEKERNVRHQLEARKNYWGAFVLKNEGSTKAFFISFPLDISELLFYDIREDTIIERKVGSLVPEQEMQDDAPVGSVDYFFRVELPQNVSRKFYFKIKDESGRIEKGFFYPNVWKVEQFYERAVSKTRQTIFFEGAVGIFLLLNLILLFQLRTKPFFHYVIYLVCILIYGFYSSGLMKQWDFFGNTPEIKFYLRLNYYLVSISYLAFMRSFLEMHEMLPFWDRIFKWLIRIATALLLLSAGYFAFVRYNVALIDVVYGIYLIFAFSLIIVFLLPLYKVQDVRAKFIFGGSILILLGVVPSIATLLFGLFNVSNVIFIQLGLAGEMVVFSLGLAYSHSASERDKQEALRKRMVMEEKSKIYTGITHEFRTPITVILGLADEIQTKSNAQITAIKRNGKQLLQLVNQMLALSKLESGKEKLQWQQGDVVTFTKYVVESFESFAAAQQIDLQIKSEIEELMMDYDAEKLQLILSNLIGNAIKFTPSGGEVKVILSTKKSHLHIRISDTGEGISAEQLPYIFDRYYQADSLLENTGSGIGLTLVKEYIQLLEGEIKVESEQRKGTTFIIQLPIHQKAVVKSPTSTVATTSPIKASPIIAPQISLKQSPKLLLIEDNKDVLQYLSLFLKDQYELRYAYDGVAGIRAAITVIPDLIISDVMMPRKNGYEVCKHLKKDERTSHVPIILLTAKADFDSKLEGLALGADVYLSKPFQKEELLVQINRLLEQRKALHHHYSLLAALPTKQYQVSNVEESFLHKLQSLIEKNMEDENFGIEAICKAIGISRTHLARKIKALTGKKTSEYIRSVRLQRAKDLLMQSDLNTGEIAFKVGFKSSAYFSSSFTAHFGQSPSDYRKANG